MRKFGVLCLALVLALGALGVGYAHWFDTVDITQTVETGKVCIGFSKQNTDEPFGEVEGKDVGSISCRLIEPIKGYVLYAGEPTPVYSAIQVTMTNAYPCYRTAVFADVANCGNIPVKINEHTFSMVEVDESGEVIAELVLVWLGPEKNYLWTYANGDPVLGMDVVNLLGSQIHPGGKDVVEYDFHVKQTSHQGATYVLTLNITGTQWNLVQ